MAFTDGIDVATGDAILASTTDNLADNTEWLRTYANVDHDFDITTGTGKHKTIQFLADSTYNVGSAAVRAANVYADSIGDTGQALTIAATTVSLPSGVVLDFNASDITITHSANTLTIAGMTSRLDLAAGILEMNNAIEWDTGVAVVAAEYSVGRDADATNQLHFNVPTGASFEFSVNDVRNQVISSAGQITNTLQPSFLVTNGTNTNVTGDGTVATIVWSTEVYDQGGDFAANTFTAPVTGRYLLTAQLGLDQAASGHTAGTMTITTSNRVYYHEWNPYAVESSSSTGGASITAVADMDAADTATVTLTVSGGAKVIDVLLAHWSGCLLH